MADSSALSFQRVPEGWRIGSALRAPSIRYKSNHFSLCPSMAGAVPFGVAADGVATATQKLLSLVTSLNNQTARI